MLPIPRTMILAVPSAMLAVLFMAPFASITASASPSPLPMPLTSDHSSLFVTTVQATRGDVGRREHKSVKPVAHYEVSSTAQRAVRYQATSSIISGHAASMTPAPKKAVHGHSGSLSTRARISTRDSTADLLVTLGLLTTHGNDVVSSSNNLSKADIVIDCSVTLICNPSRDSRCPVRVNQRQQCCFSTAVRVRAD